MDSVLSRLGERVRAVRTEQGITRRELSEATGISERYLGLVESGQGNISVLLLQGSRGPWGRPAAAAARGGGAC